MKPVVTMPAHQYFKYLFQINRMNYFKPAIVNPYHFWQKENIYGKDFHAASTKRWQLAGLEPVTALSPIDLSR